MFHRRSHPPADSGARGRGDAAALRIPGTSGFVSVHTIVHASAKVLVFAPHRDATGNPLAHRSSHMLAAAMLDRDIASDAVAALWMPALAPADAVMREAWGTRTGHEGDRHLRAAAACLLAAWALGAEIESELPRHVHGRRIRPDLQARVGRRVLLAEVGAVDADAVAALLLPGPRPRAARGDPAASHVALLPFAGRPAAAARGYLFRRAGASSLPTPTRAPWPVRDRSAEGPRPDRRGFARRASGAPSRGAPPPRGGPRAFHRPRRGWPRRRAIGSRRRGVRTGRRWPRPAHAQHRQAARIPEPATAFPDRRATIGNVSRGGARLQRRRRGAGHDGAAAPGRARRPDPGPAGGGAGMVRLTATGSPPMAARLRGRGHGRRAGRPCRATT